MSKESNNLEQVQSLLRLVDRGVVQPEIMQSLHTVIKKDPVARQFYIRQMHLRTSLLWSFASDDFHQEVEQIPFQGRRSLAKKLQRIEQKPHKFFFPTKILFGLLFVLMSFSLWISYSFFKQAFFSTATNTHQVKITENNTANIDNKQKQREQQTLTEGTIDLLLPTGVKVMIAAPAKFIVTGKNSIDLQQGKLIANVTTEAGKGFTVNTPCGRIVDLGTIFGVEVDSSGTSSVQVFKGNVELFNSVGIKTPLAAGKTMRAVAGKEEWQPAKQLSTEFYTVLEKHSSSIVSLNEPKGWLGGPEISTEVLYVMYSETPLRERFATSIQDKRIWQYCTNHFAIVHFDKTEKKWVFHANEFPIDFIPLSTDLIIARTDFKKNNIDLEGKRLVTFYQENYGTIHGIAHGYQASDINIRPDWTPNKEGDGENFADYTLKGTYFIRKKKQQ